MEKMIHVRFSPDGTVTEIGERPAGTKPQDWFDHLSRTAGNRYQTLSGGRGLFRLPGGDLDTLIGTLPK
jgi:hypothetical protein